MRTDIRDAVRTLAKNPGFALVSILTLALGIGANTAIFSVVNGVLLRPLPYADAEHIVRVWSTSGAEPKGAHAPADFLDLQHANRTMRNLAGYREDAFTITGSAGEPVRVEGVQVTVDYFDVLGVPAALGRAFTRASDAARGEPLVVLGHNMWVQQFASDPQVVNRRPRINGIPHTVIGVMPAAFDYPEGAQAWVLSPRPVPLPPIDVPGDLLESRDVHFFKAIGHLRPGVTTAQAQADLLAIAEDQSRRFPQSNGGRAVTVEPLRDSIVGDVRSALLMLLSAVGVVLLIACANVASLLLARGSGRHREIAIRAALGAGRGRLVRQLMTETLLLGALGGAAGLLVGEWAVALLLRVIPEGIPRVHQIALDARVAGIAIVVSLASALIAGLVPALKASRTGASLALRDADRTATAGRDRARTRAVLVTAEIALTLVLLVSAGLLANSFVRLQRVDPGFSVDEVTLVSLALPLSKYPDGKRQADLYQRLLEAIERRPEVQSAAVLFPTPISGQNANGTFEIEGRHAGNRADRPFAALGSVSSDYFRTLGITLIEGRPFTANDREPAPAVAIVNATLARRYFSGEDPIGKRLRFGESAEDWITIVGVAADSRNKGLKELPAPLVYLPYHTFPLAFMNVAVRSSAGTSTVASLVRGELKRIDPELPIDSIRPLREILTASVAEPRFRTMLLVGFAAIAVMLAAVGLYGLMSFSVAQRTREIGIRIALGARPRQVILPIVREGLWIAVIGIVLGLAGSVVASRILGEFLFGVGVTDPITYASVVSLLFSIALLATYIPSRWATRIDPISALKTE
jgi:predicted permease